MIIRINIYSLETGASLREQMNESVETEEILPAESKAGP